MSVVVVGANHRTAPLDLLERMAVTGDRLPKLLHALDGGADTSEVVVLATCNRTEVYLIAERFHGAYAEVRDFFADLTYLPPERFAESLYVHYDDQAVRHLFEVAAGLDSAVPGEHEILGQVRDAWEVARLEGTARRGLNLLFRHALEVGKRARTETSIARHVTSVSQAAVILAGERLVELRGVDRPTGDAGACTAAGARAGLSGARAVLVGAGSMGRGMGAFLADAGVAEMVVANRTPERAAELVRQATAGRDHLSARAAGLDELPAAMAGADVVFAATGAPDAVVTPELVAPALVGRAEPLVIVDIAMPRDVDPAVAALQGVELLDMDAVAAFTEAGIAGRRREVAAVREIVEEEIARHAAATNARQVAPIITSLREKAECIRCSELERSSGRLSGLTDAQLDAVEAMTRGLVAKLLHEPTVRLRDAAGSARGDRLVDAVRDLFDLPDGAEPGAALAGNPVPDDADGAVAPDDAAGR
ncbi:glutamyl-tRNA reductase [Dermatobacter hominis]|uniref:glutamyl-tRNA reductase n=1 Tax=Dermatobacter hominis TaxID=2884263 RepID=UPI001D120C70|nr:glutamyl-tRNA reductase [Dermatobacter hominis]UDY33998.1 glutamyl-tRNA reductase [Dermatobacter hominis]